MVRKIILNPKINKSCGPDEKNPQPLKVLVDTISKPITLPLNITMENWEIRNDRKCGNISPIFKKGARNKAENYRPISLKSIICKLIESFVKEAIVDHMMENNLLCMKSIDS